jgi:hypothetical protein
VSRIVGRPREHLADNGFRNENLRRESFEQVELADLCKGDDR